MGLSNNERFEKIVYSITNIIEKAEGLTSKFDKLKNLTQELWPAFLGRESNGLFWIIGGGFSSSNLTEANLLSVAFKQQMIREDREDVFLRPKKEGESYSDSSGCRKTLDRMLDIGYLASNQEVSNIIEINQWIENLAYALCRYDDDFSESLLALNKIIRKMQGELFNIIRNDATYFRAWLLKNIISKCLNVWSDDIVSKWVRKDNIHHSLTLSDKHETQELQETFFYLQNKSYKEITTQEKLLILLALCRHRFHYKHQFENLKLLVEAHNSSSEDKIDESKLIEVFNWCKEQKVECDKTISSSVHRYCYLTDEEIN